MLRKVRVAVQNISGQELKGSLNGRMRHKTWLARSDAYISTYRYLF